MQDFAKSRRVLDGAESHLEPASTLHIPSVGLGCLLGVAVSLMGFKITSHQQLEERRGDVSTPPLEKERVELEFYQELKREDLYPAYTESENN